MGGGEKYRFGHRRSCIVIPETVVECGTNRGGKNAKWTSKQGLTLNSGCVAAEAWEFGPHTLITRSTKSFPKARFSRLRASKFNPPGFPTTRDTVKFPPKTCRAGRFASRRFVDVKRWIKIRHGFQNSSLKCDSSRVQPNTGQLTSI